MTTTNVVHAALWLVLVLAGVGASFLLLGAEFVGITQILVYIGAIVVLFLFGIMLTRAPIGADPKVNNRYWYVGLVVALPLLGVLGYVLIDAFDDDRAPRARRCRRTAEVERLDLLDVPHPVRGHRPAAHRRPHRRHRPGAKE